jgi:dihydropteroate synthase/2-amino-4-hydroxy-6-hydroxymethyldihydropteridine diphosphokinase
MNRCVLALGSNLGERAASIHAALDLLRTTVGARVERTSLLYDTAPQYVTEQPRFLNAACEISTTLAPHELLRAVKGVEQRLGRQLGVEAARFGPRPIDIDLLLYYPAAADAGRPLALQSETLTLPHERLTERAFVLRPLADLDPARLLPHGDGSVSSVAQLLAVLRSTEQGATDLAELQQVTPLPGRRPGETEACFAWGARTYLMGIVNMTPDSFSDGGSFGMGAAGAEAAVEHGLALARSGADVLDIGGHSTKPGFEPVSEQEEVERVAAVVSRLRAASDAGLAEVDPGSPLRGAGGGGVGMGGRLAISVDTFRPAVALAAINEGADIINDVSGGLHSGGEMYRVAAELGAPIVLMDHGTDPVALHAPHNTTGSGGGSSGEGSIVDLVGQSLARMVDQAQASGMARWQLMIDPGLGFAKPVTGENLELIRRLPDVKAVAGGHSGLPLLLGASRKRFTGEATWHSRVSKSTPAPFDGRDFATAGFCAAAVAGGGVDMVRVHNVECTGDAVRAADMLNSG